ncbi:NAD-dependent epimerase/dehydratase family protein [Phocaeicola barnesiae]|uniref:NAD-dependent epimerase/dehydratase family protein n=1 Tax=Phocaeicola barnesiae TaxID=376804 RepID=UPI0025A48C2A|nr:NAD(P)-dependent oxidoreductase [Phocaeicola barnesiae]MDM8255767.1 NAD(P)-dependent oxidoreductase [Phocaeicola barnesiae]
MRILVTGANGYIGKHVVSELLNMEHQVIACDLHTLNVDERAEKLEKNLFTASDNIFNETGCPDVCIHLAWRDGFVHNSKNHLGDLSDHFRFLTSMIDGGLKQLVVMGTMHEVGYYEGAIDENTPCNPLSMYGIAKDTLRRAMILYCKEHDCVLQWCRAFYILGDDKNNHSIFTKILEADAAGKEKFPFTTGKTKYDFITVTELAHQIASVAIHNEISGIINCCSGKPISLAERVEQYIAEHGLKIKLEYGAYPDRPYDSPCVYGDASIINSIISDN